MKNREIFTRKILPKKKKKNVKNRGDSYPNMRGEKPENFSKN